MSNDLKEKIVEEFENCFSAKEVAELYAELLHEIKGQMECCMEIYVPKES